MASLGQGAPKVAVGMTGEGHSLGSTSRRPGGDIPISMIIPLADSGWHCGKAERQEVRLFLSPDAVSCSHRAIPRYYRQR